MKEYIMRVLCMALISTLADILLPEGNLRRFAAPLLGLSVMAAILLPAVSFLTGSTDIVLPAIEMTADEKTYQNALLDTYSAKIEAAIMEKDAGVTAQVTVGENYEIEHITLCGQPSARVMLFIQKDLGVARNAITIT